MAHARALASGTVPVIVNTSAGWLRGVSRSARARTLVAAFRDCGVEPQVRFVRPAHVARAIREARRRGAPAVFVGGGDGTLNCAANALVGTSTALGVLPVGTRNHFAADLGLPPRDVPGAIRAMLEGEVREIDVGEVNGHVFINNLALGFYPRVVRDGARHTKHIGLAKTPALAFALLGALWRRPSVQLRIHAPTLETTQEVDAPLLFIGNNEYSIELGRFGRRESLVRGELAVYWTDGLSRTGFAVQGVRALLTSRTPPALTKLLIPEVEIRSKRRAVDVALDGEVKRLRSPLLVRSRPGALRVVAPRTP